MQFSPLGKDFFFSCSTNLIAEEKHSWRLALYQSPTILVKIEGKELFSNSWITISLILAYCFLFLLHDFFCNWTKPPSFCRYFWVMARHQSLLVILCSEILEGLIQNNLQIKISAPQSMCKISSPLLRIARLQTQYIKHWASNHIRYISLWQELKKAHEIIQCPRGANFIPLFGDAGRKQLQHFSAFTHIFKLSLLKPYFCSSKNKNKNKSFMPLYSFFLPHAEELNRNIKE